MSSAHGATGIQHVSPLQYPILSFQREILTDTEPVPDVESGNIPMANGYSIHTGDWVRAIYDYLWYLGRVLGVDGNECLVSFMTTHERGAKKTFQWPSSADTGWIAVGTATVNVVCEPQAIGRSKRFFYHPDFWVTCMYIVGNVSDLQIGLPAK